MEPIKLSEGIFFLGVQDWDRELFDEIIPLPQGTSYNSYLIKGSEKIALIDGVDPKKEGIFIENIKELNLDKIDYIISNHAEQDHSGAIPKVLSLYPETKVVTNEKCKNFLMDLLSIPKDKFLTIKDGEELSLGNKTLKFFFTPWVHWPETMITYLKEDKILFPCDFLASHIATGEIFSKGDDFIKSTAKRYYAEIMMPYRVSIKKHLELIKNLEIDIIAPSHGVIYTNPKFIIDAYEDWVSDNLKNEAILIYVSMHGSIEKAVEFLERKLANLKIPYKKFNVTKADIGEIAMALVASATLIIATPVFLANPHPNISFVLSFINDLRPKTRFAGIISSFSWGQRVEEQIKAQLNFCKLEYLPSIILKGYPKEKDFSSIENMALSIREKHKEIGIL